MYVCRNVFILSITQLYTIVAYTLANARRIPSTLVLFTTAETAVIPGS